MEPDRNGVIAACRAFLEGKRAGYAAEIAALDEAAARETKSSAGDKYETAREMIAQSRNIMGKNLAEAEAGIAALDRIAALGAASPGPAGAVGSDGAGHGAASSGGGAIAFGSVVETSQGWFLVGPAFGEADLPGGTVIRSLSLASPLGQALRGRPAGSALPWKGAVLEVRRILG